MTWNWNFLEYQAGFHMFTSETDARRYARYLNDQPPPIQHCVIKVKYDEMLATGTERTNDGTAFRCLVAEKMTLLEEV